jgi:hypothetical protein
MTDDFTTRIMPKRDSDIETVMVVVTGKRCLGERMEGRFMLWCLGRVGR